MNKLFIGNGILLMVLMGFQQWFTCYTGFSRGVSVDLFGEKIFLEVLQVEIVKRLTFVFAAIALVSPFIMIRWKRLSSQTKTEKVAVFGFAPLFFFSMGWCGESLPHSWSISELAGPRTIQAYFFSPKI
jgi:hypothetical protein